MAEFVKMFKDAGIDDSSSSSSSHPVVTENKNTLTWIMTQGFQNSGNLCLCTSIASMIG